MSDVDPSQDDQLEVTETPVEVSETPAEVSETPAEVAETQAEVPETSAEASASASPSTPHPKQPSINLLILITGSIAAVKTGLLLDQLANERCHIRLASTSSAFHFLHRAQPSKTGIPFKSILTDDQEWMEWQAMNDAVVHIELRRWADLVVIAPLDANSLAKIANGLCDNLVTCVMRAWQVKEKPVIVCPAMNTAMWMHPITDQQITTLRNWYTSPTPALTIETVTADEPVVADAETHEETPGDTAAPAAADTAAPVAAPVMLPATLEAAMFQVVGPVTKRLACGDVGLGGMASVEDIAQHVRHTMALLRQHRAAAAAAESAQTPVTSTEA